jgi:hypothetical protein
MRFLASGTWTKWTNYQQNLQQHNVYWLRKQAKMDYDTSAIRNLLKAAFNDEDLATLCYDHFPPVYEGFATGMTRPWKIQLLIDHCERNNELGKLLRLVEERNPNRYEEFAPRILTSSPAESPQTPSLNGHYSKSRLELILAANLSSIAPERHLVAIEAAVRAFANELDIPRDQVRVLQFRIGSVALQLEVPTEVANHVLELYEANDPSIQDLGIQQLSVIDVSQVSCLGRISTALSSESTQDEFYFWVDNRRLVEATQLVRVTMPLPAENPRIGKLEHTFITVVGVVEEVRRQSESRTLGADHARYGGRIEANPLLEPTGFTYAKCKVLDINPLLFVPLTEGLPVFLANEEEAGRGYGYPGMEEANADLIVGLLRNGGTDVAGAAKLDTRYMLGEFGGHVNVTGVAGTGTKTSFLMVLVKMLLLHSKEVTQNDPANPLYSVPIVFNVKGNDLMWISRSNKHFDASSSDWDTYRGIWGEKLFSDFAQPFTDASFYSYPVQNGSLKSGLPEGTRKYSWGLKDVIEWGVERYLFSVETRTHELMQGVLEDAFQYVSKESARASSGRTLDNSTGIRNFRELIEWLKEATVKPKKDEGMHHLIQRQHDRSTIKATVRRLNNILTGARGVLVKDSASGEPPQVASNETRDPIVIDVDGLEAAPQRFVVASIIERIRQHREKHAERRQRYIIVLDELNRFVPKGSSDEVSKLFEHVAAQLRSQGVILFGAQQKASNISALVWENAATKALGRTGAAELSTDIWRQTLPTATRSRAANLGPSEKIIVQDTFNYPMLANIPFTPWATRKDEIGSGSSDDDEDVLDLLTYGD